MNQRSLVLGAAALSAVIASVSPVFAEDTVGVPVTLKRGITQTVDQIMERDRLLPPPLLRSPRAVEQELETPVELREDPNAPPPMSHWPPIPDSASGVLAPVEPPNLPQTVGTSFKATSSAEANRFPPDSMGDVGPTQILIHVNGRIKVVDRTGAAGPLNVDHYTFWAPVLPSNYPGDPQVRYDRLSGRWFVLAVDFPLGSGNNQILLAVSSGPTITGSASFTFYAFRVGDVLPGDSALFCDYPNLGVDANALYVGCNMQEPSIGYQYSSAYVIRKSSVLAGGPIVVTGFGAMGTTGTGPFAPRGVDNDDPTWTEGYFIGTDRGNLNRIFIRRVTDPGGTPALAPSIMLAVSSTNVLDQLAMGSGAPLNSQLLWLFAGAIHKNKITGVTSLWTAHSVETDTTCTPQNSGNFRRLGARWYEIGDLAGTPTITQFGTLCTTTAGSVTTNSQRGFLYPTVSASGQGHMAMAASHASETEFAGVAAAGRLRTDPLGGTRAPATIVQAGLAGYQVLDSAFRNRWGDYSFTDVDPNDDQTIWTFQEYADTPANNWGLRAVQLKAPPPPVINTTSNPVCIGPAATVTILGMDACAVPTCPNGLCTGGGPCPEFFDPGPDTGGPGYANHIQATVTGGVTVNSASIVIPANPATQRVTQVALSLNTSAATPGLKTVTIINPDGQTVTGTDKITVVGNRTPVAITGAYSICETGSTQLNGTGSSDPDATCGDSIVNYEWDLNNDGTFDITGATPTVTYAQLTSLGLVAGAHTIKLRVTDSHAAPNTGTGSITLVTDGGTCSDANACTQTDTCNAGTCVGSNPVICTASDQCHDVGVCNTATGVCSNPNGPDGSSCNDANACTLTDMCQTGVCVGGSPQNCSDGSTCTTDVCDAETGACSNPAVANGTGCNDANSCTQSDSCQNGVCTGANPVVCNPFSQCHIAGVCNPGTGICSNPQAPNGTTCNDANACTSGETCTAGSCGGGTPTPPGELVNARFSDKVTFLWDSVPNSPSYDILRGDISALPVGPGFGDELCFNDTGVSSVTDATPPLADQGFWYVVRAATLCGQGNYGTQKDLTPRVSTTCP